MLFSAISNWTCIELCYENVNMNSYLPFTDENTCIMEAMVNMVDDWNSRLQLRRLPSNCSTNWTRCRVSWMKPTEPSMTSMLPRRSCPLRTQTCWGSWRKQSHRCHSSASSRSPLPPNLRTPNAWLMRSLG